MYSFLFLLNILDSTRVRVSFKAYRVVHITKVMSQAVQVVKTFDFAGFFQMIL